MKLLQCEDLSPLIKITCRCDGLNGVPTLSRIFEYLAPVGGPVWGALGHVRSSHCRVRGVGFEDLKTHAFSSSLSLLPACGSRHESSASSSYHRASTVPSWTLIPLEAQAKETLLTIIGLFGPGV